MKQLKFLFIAIVLIAGCSSSDPDDNVLQSSSAKQEVKNQAKKDETLRLSITPVKEKYSVGENVELNVALKNVSKKKWLLNRFVDQIDGIGHQSNFRFDAIKNVKETCKYDHEEQSMLQLITFKQREINPGEKIEYKVTLNYWYNMGIPGKYSVQAIYSYDISENKINSLWTGEIKSNTIEIEIQEKKE